MKRVICSLAGMAMIAAPASAEPESGSRIDRRPMAVVDSANDAVVSRVVNQFARCVANLRPQWADGVLAMETMSAAQIKSTNREANGIHTCYATGQFDLKLSPLSFLGGLAEQRVVTAFGQQPVAALSRVSDAQLFASPAAPKSTVEDLALCIARKDPDASRKLMNVQSMSKEEGALIGRLVPHLGGCVPQGMNIKFNRQTVRAYSSLGLHRLLANQPAILAARTPGAVR